MKRLKAIAQILSAGVLSLGIGIFANEGVNAQAVPVFLLEQTCVNVGGGYWTPASEIIPVAGRLYNAVMQMYPVSLDRSAIVTCNLGRFANAPRFQNLRLQVGNPSTNPNASFITTVSLDGTPVSVTQVQPTATESLLINLGDAQNVSIETRCVERATCSNSIAWFFQAQLEPTTLSSNLIP